MSVPEPTTSAAERLMDAISAAVALLEAGFGEEALAYLRSVQRDHRPEPTGLEGRGA